jgi:hypothetical protein
LRTSAGGAHVIRLRQPDEAELCLTWPVIQRISGALAESGRVRTEAGSDWVQVRLHSTSDVRLAVLLASLAIRAHAQHQATS